MPPKQRAADAWRRVSTWYGRWERPISSISLVGGFVFDAVTLRRVDLFWENFWVVAHLSIVGCCIILANAIERREKAETDPARLHFWLVNIMQFFFGGIWSTFLVYYFRSGSLAVDWPFLALLAAAFVANERLKHHYARLGFQIALFYLSLFTFAIFIVPVFVHAVGPFVFLASGAASLAAIAVFLLVLRIAAQETFRRQIGRIAIIVGGTFAAVNALYFLSVIPPLPLSITDSGIYHAFAVNAPGRYTATYEPQGWSSFFMVGGETVHLTPGSPLYAYTAVFSPQYFNMEIIHEWQWYNASSSQWMTESRIPLTVTGGQNGGWRTFSMNPNPAPGAWRVNVETQSGAVIGRLDFTVLAASTTPPLATRVIN